MKKTILSMCLCSAVVACAQSNKVPTLVKDNFTKQFSQAKHVRWDHEEEDEWEAEFKVNGVEYSAAYSQEGVWMETEEEVAWNAVPEVVKISLLKSCKEKEIKEAFKVKRKNSEFYEFDIKSNGTYIEIAIDEQGKVLKKEYKDEED